MLDILLISPDYPWPVKFTPMGILYLASYLEVKGSYNVKALDLGVEQKDDTALLDSIDRRRPKIVGFSFMTPQSGYAYGLAKKIKKSFPEIITIAGGFHPSALPREAIEYFDIAVIGEGEESLKEIADHAIRSIGNLDEIEGIAYKNGSTSIVKERRNSISDLDDIPFPAWHHVPMDQYRGMGMGLDEKKPFMTIISSRGCPNFCIFCASHVVNGRKCRMRSPENIVQEMKVLKENHGVTQFDFQEDTMTVSQKRVMRFCALLVKEKLNVKWVCNARVDTADEEMLLMMKKAGCARIHFGVESASQDTLSFLKKRTTIEQIKRAHYLAKKAGLPILSFYIVGIPGEGMDEINHTLELARELESDWPGLTFATPYPGTELYEMATRKGWLNGQGWDQYYTTITGKGFLPIMKNDVMNRKELFDTYKFVLEELKTACVQTNGS